VIPVCRVDDVPEGEGRAVTILGHRVAVFRAESGWYALDDGCPHRAGPLSDGVLAERSVICPLHERRFDLASGEPLGHDCAAVVAHRVEVRGEDVFVDLVEAAEGGYSISSAATSSPASKSVLGSPPTQGELTPASR
jgi:NAD(P)H-dependent nitrite reductase small subunit